MNYSLLIFFPIFQWVWITEIKTQSGINTFSFLNGNDQEPLRFEGG